jgi:hypothetical protein
MSKSPNSRDLDELRPALPRQLPSIIKQELPSLVEEIVGEIRDAIPEYARPLDGPYDQTLRSGVERSVNGFAEWLAAPTPSLDRRDDICRKLGRFEAYKGRQLDTLQSAYRVGALTSWRRIVTLHQRYGLAPATLSMLAEALFGYMEELASISLEGYLDAKAESDEETEAGRRRLLHLIVSPSAVPRDMLVEQAEPVRWAVPETVTLVALRPGAPLVRTQLDGDLLTDLDGTEPYLLVPGPLSTERRAMLRAALCESKAAAGLSVPLARAAESLRWARRVLDLVHEEIIDDGSLTLCEDHLVTLWLLSDGPLIDQIARRRFAPLAGMTKHRQEQLVETLLAWLRTRGTATRISEDLGVHPQTVRYRMRQIEQAFGVDLSDPDARFATEVVLRALWLRERLPREKGPAPPGTDAEPDLTDREMHEIR